MIKTIRLLLVEDDASAAMLAQIALEEAWSKRNTLAEITVCTNGEEAIRHLESDRPLPHLILTDVKMPLLDGIRLLKLLKQDKQLRSIPVVMVTTSDDPKDIAAAFDGQCAGYLLKKANFNQFSADLEALQRYWEASKLP